MGRIIDRRRVMGGHSLPYDAEVEYLESTGTQWIDTGIIPNDGLLIEFEGAFEEQNKNIVCSYETIQKRLLCFIYNPYNLAIWKGATVKYLRVTPALHTFYNVYLDFRNNSLIVKWNGLEILNESVSSAFPSVPIRVFFEDYLNSATKGKIKKLKITGSDDLVLFDAKSVRIGSTGYMYDKVSKQLFGNSGTGDFILGPDVTGGGGKRLILITSMPTFGERRAA